MLITGIQKKKEKQKQNDHGANPFDRRSCPMTHSYLRPCDKLIQYKRRSFGDMV